MNIPYDLTINITLNYDGSLNVKRILYSGAKENLSSGQVTQVGLALINAGIANLIANVEKMPKHVPYMDIRREYDRKRKELTNQVIERYGKVCLICGSKRRITIDHIIPITKGGTNDLDNLQPLCVSCNSRKGDRM